MNEQAIRNLVKSHIALALAYTAVADLQALVVRAATQLTPKEDVELLTPYREFIAAACGGTGDAEQLCHLAVGAQVKLQGLLASVGQEGASCV